MFRRNTESLCFQISDGIVLIPADSLLFQQFYEFGSLYNDDHLIHNRFYWLLGNAENYLIFDSAVSAIQRLE